MTPPAAARHVPRLRAGVLSYRVLMRQVATPGRLAALGLLGAVMILIGWLVGRSVADGESLADGLLRDAAAYTDGFGLVIIVPIVSLVFGSSVLGEAREDGTLVYLWLRPMDRGPVVAAALAAAATASLPLTVIPTVAGGWLAADGVEGSMDLVAGALAASALGTAAYSCLFVLVGLLLRKPILWGIAYVLLWEGLAVQLGDFAARLSLRGYTRSVLSGVSDIHYDFDFDARPTAAAVTVLAAVALASLALATLRLNRLEVD